MYDWIKLAPLTKLLSYASKKGVHIYSLHVSDLKCIIIRLNRLNHDLTQALPNIS